MRGMVVNNGITYLQKYVENKPKDWITKGGGINGNKWAISEEVGNQFVDRIWQRDVRHQARRVYHSKW
jgi:hypothetical protein